MRSILKTAEAQNLQFSTSEEAEIFWNGLKEVEAMQSSPESFDRIEAQKILLGMPKPLNEEDLQANMLAVLNAAFPYTEELEISRMNVCQESNLWGDDTPFVVLVMKGNPDSRYCLRKNGNTYHVMCIDCNEYGTGATEKEVVHMPVVLAYHEDGNTPHYAFAVKSRYNIETGNFRRCEITFK